GTSRLSSASIPGTKRWVVWRLRVARRAVFEPFSHDNNVRAAMVGLPCKSVGKGLFGRRESGWTPGNATDFRICLTKSEKKSGRLAQRRRAAPIVKERNPVRKADGAHG